MLIAVWRTMQPKKHSTPWQATTDNNRTEGCLTLRVECGAGDASFPHHLLTATYVLSPIVGVSGFRPPVLHWKP